MRGTRFHPYSPVADASSHSGSQEVEPRPDHLGLETQVDRLHHNEYAQDLLNGWQSESWFRETNPAEYGPLSLGAANMNARCGSQSVLEDLLPHYYQDGSPSPTTPMSMSYTPPTAPGHLLTGSSSAPQTAQPVSLPHRQHVFSAPSLRAAPASLTQPRAASSPHNVHAPPTFAATSLANFLSGQPSSSSLHPQPGEHVHPSTAVEHAPGQARALPATPGRDRFPCSQCLSDFGRQQELARHQRSTHHSEEPLYTCCGIPLELACGRYGMSSGAISAERRGWYNGRAMVGGCANATFNRRDSYRRHLAQFGCVGDSYGSWHPGNQ